MLGKIYSMEKPPENFAHFSDPFPEDLFREDPSTLRIQDRTASSPGGGGSLPFACNMYIYTLEREDSFSAFLS